MTPVRFGSWVSCVRDEGITGRTPIAGQALVNQFLDTVGSNTMWTQQTTAAHPAAVTVGATAPTTDPWNLAAVEVVPAT